MHVTLCMVVLNEAHNLPDCLGPIADLFDSILIADTGSTDGTPELLKARWGIEALPRQLMAEECFSLAPLRNELLENVVTPWALRLDADERLDRDAVRRMIESEEPSGPAGYFVPWLTEIAGTTFEDYKLVLARREVRDSGLVHDVLQTDMRQRGLKAGWYPDLPVRHFPDHSRLAAKAERYRQLLVCALGKAPQWYRYHWFLGYNRYRAGDYSAARHYLDIVCRALPGNFPVECLNSHMVLAEIEARTGNAERIRELIESARLFFAENREDFELAVNFRLQRWFQAAEVSLALGNLKEIRAYDFMS